MAVISNQKLAQRIGFPRPGSAHIFRLGQEVQVSLSFAEDTEDSNTRFNDGVVIIENITDGWTGRCSNRRSRVRSGQDLGKSVTCLIWYIDV